jgi:hypothetical protein
MPLEMVGTWEREDYLKVLAENMNQSIEVVVVETMMFLERELMILSPLAVVVVVALVVVVAPQQQQIQHQHASHASSSQSSFLPQHLEVLPMILLMQQVMLDLTWRVNPNHQVVVVEQLLCCCFQ